MKRTITLILSVMLLLSLCGSCVYAEESVQEEAEAVSAEAAGTESPAEEVRDQECEWNVLIYLCGTDLESDYSSATKNLQDIAATLPEESVNILIETGGAKGWDPEGKLGLGIANDRLQRWRYGKDGFVLVDETQEASMSDDRTLSGFIRWSAENYSAKKNMLVLWDHGGGSSAGLISDENYDGAIMPLYSLEKALGEGGTHFDLVLTDACLMASLEMCQALSPYADYLAASEEIMAGDGTNYKSWVQYLYDRPECSAVQLGKRICDASQQYYTEKDNSSEGCFFTMSLIDLSKTDEVAKAFNAFIHEASDLVQDPGAFYTYAAATHYAENYYFDTMYDLFDLSRRAENGGVSKETAHALQDAVEDAVLYNLRSDNHMYSHGLSVYYPLNDSAKDLDHFARSCKNAEQLAFLDSISLKWEAPDWVYEETERQPELDRSAYVVVPEAACTEDGSGAYMTLRSGANAAVYMSYALYYKDPESGVLYTLGESGDLIPEVDEEDGTIRFELGFDGTWPTLAGKPLCMTIADETESYILYNVPIKLEKMNYQMRILVNKSEDDQETDSEAGPESGVEETPEEGETAVQNEADGSPYELLGVWDGFDSHNGLPGRNAISLSELDGMKFFLYDVVYSAMLEKVADYLDSVETQFSKDTLIEREKLPAGEYMIRFVVRDVFDNEHYSLSVNANWDGETVSYSFPES